MTGLVRTALKALLVSVITAAVLILVLGFIAYKNSDPSRFIPIFGTVTLILSAFCGGAVSRRGGENILSSMFFAGIFILVVFGTALAFGGSADAVETLLNYLGSIAAAVVGGMLFAGGGSKKPKSMKKYKKYIKKAEKGVK